MGAAMKLLRAPLMRAVAIYAISVPLAWAITPTGAAWEFLAAALALMLVPFARLAPWWLVINAVFLPALIAVLHLELPATWALVPLAVLMLLYGTIWRSQVPLFFSSRGTQTALASLLPPGRSISFLDVGCGDGKRDRRAPCADVDRVCAASHHAGMRNDGRSSAARVSARYAGFEWKKPSCLEQSSGAHCGSRNRRRGDAQQSSRSVMPRGRPTRFVRAVERFLLTTVRVADISPPVATSMSAGAPPDFADTNDTC